MNSLSTVEENAKKEESGDDNKKDDTPIKNGSGSGSGSGSKRDENTEVLAKKFKLLMDKTIEKNMAEDAKRRPPKLLIDQNQEDNKEEHKDERKDGVFDMNDNKIQVIHNKDKKDHKSNTRKAMEDMVLMVQHLINKMFVGI